MPPGLWLRADEGSNVPPSGAPRSEGVANDFLRALWWWLGLLLIYLLLASETGGAELSAGALLALVATVALTAVRRVSGVRFELKSAWLRPVATVPLRVVTDSFVVLAANCRRPFRARGSGRFSEREFNPGNDHPSSRTRRALVTTAVSLTPNSVVVAVDRAGHRLLVHELVPTKDTERDPDWPL